MKGFTTEIVGMSFFFCDMFFLALAKLSHAWDWDLFIALHFFSSSPK